MFINLKSGRIFFLHLLPGRDFMYRFTLFFFSFVSIAASSSIEANANQTESPYGYWPSPITEKSLIQNYKGFGYTALDGENIYWTESRPSEGGRCTIIKCDLSGKMTDLLPKEYSALSRVHEYGGIPFAVKTDNLYFINAPDQALYFCSPEGTITPVISEKNLRFAEPVITSAGIFAVAELHGEGSIENCIVLIKPESGTYTKIVCGSDFYASPTYNENTKELAWISWNHPDMPWDHTELWVGTLLAGGITKTQKIADNGRSSVISPKWSSEGILYYISDKSGWWNIYRYQDSIEENIYPVHGEFGYPLWNLGQSRFDFKGDKIIAAYVKNGIEKMLEIDPETKKGTEFPLSGTCFGQIRSNDSFVSFLECNPLSGTKLCKVDFSDNKKTILVENTSFFSDPEEISIGQHLTFPCPGGIAHGYYYPPKNKAYKGLQNSLPPLIVKVHGGPTASTKNVFSLSYQYWTNRGFAILDVDYRGSTGYGREYRKLLEGNWGITDTEDVESGALFLVKKGLVDPKKIAITGGSAGGFTVLNALITGNVFTTGASFFGVSDLELLLQDTHKFEAKYFERLIGPYPEAKELYVLRSPVNSADKLNRPVIFFQGMEDKVVPPNQAEKMYNALKDRGIETQLFLYEGEGHGFRKAENIEESLREERLFYLKVFESAQ